MASTWDNLRNAPGVYPSSAVGDAKLAFADIDWTQIGDAPLGTDYDIDGNSLTNAPVFKLESGTNLPPAFVSLAPTGRSTLFMEFPDFARQQELYLNVYSKPDNVLLFSSSIKLHVGDVSQMVGWENLRSVAGGSGGVPTHLSTEDWPPEAHEPGNVVFVHGYNMEEDDEVRLWAQNVFKKLWWAGLDRGFIAVQWRGNEGQTPLELPVLGYVTPNYYGNVQNAFASASALKDAMDGIDGPKWFIAHSLGNMLVSAAIQDYQMPHEKYFMLNAAVATEAFDLTNGITQESHDNMTPEAWTNYTDRVRATHWFERFPDGDGRRLLTWKGRFSNVTNIVNFYSSQDEVVCNGDGRPKDIARAYAWYNQETLKGMWSFMLHEYEGGWEFNSYYNITTNYWIGPVLQTETYHMLPADADQLPDEQLQQIPFFLDFHNPEMHTSPNGAIVASNYLYRAEMLAYAIPSESYAVGANPLPGMDDIAEEHMYAALNGNYNMAVLFTYGQNDLPENGSEPEDKHRDWQHSTFVQRSYKRVNQLFKVITKHIKEANKSLVSISFLLLANVGCASERLYVKVIGDDGRPVANAIVRVGYNINHVVFGRGRSHHEEAITDTNGNAVVKFDCASSSFGWSVRAEGYYSSNPRREQFRFELVEIPPAFYKVILHEYEMRGEIMLYRKKNPQPMYAYTRELERESPIANGRYGFDLQCYDWLPPLGNGKVADFYYVRDRKDIENVKVALSKGKGYGLMSFRNGTPNYPVVGDVVGRIEFDEKCGAYIRKCTGNENFPSTYGVETNAINVSEIPIRIEAQKGNVWLHEGRVINDDEYMVIRSRVKCDERGNIVSANYSKLIGPVGFGSLVAIKESVFNPRPNDTNLEFDPQRNLYQGKVGRGMIP